MKYIKRFCKWIFQGIPEIKVTTQLYTMEFHRELDGKRILITGGGSGLGYAIAKRFAEEGAMVIITGRNLDKLKTAQENIGSNCIYFVFDNSNIEGLENLYNNVKENVGDINGLVCNAGISLHEKMIYDVSEENYDKQFNINLKGTYFLLQKFIKLRNISEQFNIIVISSERGIQCDDIPYGLTKAALNSLTRGISRRFYKEKVRINAIAPGITVSSMTGIKETDNLYEPRISSGRYFMPIEVAEVALFLMSDRSKCISGEIIATDAGNYLSSYI